jgi:hypothetical protein
MTNNQPSEEAFFSAAIASLLATPAGREALKGLTPEQQRTATRAADKVWNPYRGKHRG